MRYGAAPPAGGTLAGSNARRIRSAPLKTQHYLDLVSGRSRGSAAAAARLILSAAEGPYALAVASRNAWYAHHASAVHRAAAPVICVGNLTVGGTGKTPMVKWIARRLRQDGHRVAILSRGYGASRGAANDEALELEQSLPDVPHLQGRDRVALAEVATTELHSGVLLMDDGFQHRRLARDLDIVLLDATAPFGHGRLLPRGLLREPVSGLQRAGAVCLTRAPLVSLTQRRAIRDRVREIAPAAHWCEAEHAPSALLRATGGEAPVGGLAGKRLLAFCGIGNPDAFRRTLLGAGGEVIAMRRFPDHHAYNRSDIDAMAELSSEVGADCLVCTHKDLVKLGVDAIGDTPLWAVSIEMRLTTGEEGLSGLIRQTAGGSAAG